MDNTVNIRNELESGIEKRISLCPKNILIVSGNKESKVRDKLLCFWH
jgi:hypothetical protein